LGAVEENLPLDAVERPVGVLLLDPLAVDLFTEDMEPGGFEAISRIDARASPVGGPIGQGIAE
jgi:hypothetical protein